MLAIRLEVTKSESVLWYLRNTAAEFMIFNGQAGESNKESVIWKFPTSTVGKTGVVPAFVGINTLF